MSDYSCAWADSSNALQETCQITWTLRCTKMFIVINMTSSVRLSLQNVTLHCLRLARLIRQYRTCHAYKYKAQAVWRG